MSARAFSNAIWEIGSYIVYPFLGAKLRIIFDKRAKWPRKVLNSGLNLIDVDVAMHHGIDGECRDTFHAEFIHDILAVGDDGG